MVDSITCGILRVCLLGRARDHAYTLSSKNDDEDQGAPRMGGYNPSIPGRYNQYFWPVAKFSCVVLLNKQHPPEHENELEYSVYTLGQAWYHGKLRLLRIVSGMLAAGRAYRGSCWPGPAFIRCLECTTVQGTNALLPVS